MQVLWGTRSQGPRADRKAKKRREPSVREDGAERSGERNRESTNRNRIRGSVEQGERAENREALATKAKRGRSGGCAGKAMSLTWGDLASCLKGQRPSKDDAEREVSSGRSTVDKSPAGTVGLRKVGNLSDGKGQTNGRANRP